MKKYILYQTKKGVWVVNKNQRDRYVYEEEIKPIRILICDITDEWIEAIIEIFKSDKEQFIDIIQEELNQNFSTLYMN